MISNQSGLIFILTSISRLVTKTVPTPRKNNAFVTNILPSRAPIYLQIKTCLNLQSRASLKIQSRALINLRKYIVVFLQSDRSSIEAFFGSGMISQTELESLCGEGCMKYQRVFNFIYFGFIDNESMTKNPTINADILNRTLNQLGDDYKNHEGLYKHAALMSADLLHRYLLENVRSYKETRPWILPIDYMNLVAAEKDGNARLKCTPVEKSTDADCISFIHEHYINKYEFFEIKKEKLDNEKNAPKDAGYNAAVITNPYDRFKAILSPADLVHVDNDKYPEFYKLFELYIKFFEYEVGKNSLHIADDLNYTDNLYYRMVAVNVIEQVSSFKKHYPEEMGLNVKVKGLTEFFCHVVAGSLLTSNLLPALQAFIDLLLFPILFKSEAALESRRKYIEWVMDETKMGYQHIRVFGHQERIKTLTDKHGEQLTNYIAKNICSKFSEKSWFCKMQDSAIKSGQHYDFVITALSLLPAKTNIRAVLNKATSYMSTKKHRDATSDSKSTVKLSIDLDEKLKKTIGDICKKEETSIREFVTEAILNELEGYYPEEFDAYIDGDKVTRRPPSASALRRGAAYKKTKGNDHLQ